VHGPRVSADIIVRGVVGEHIVQGEDQTGATDRIVAFLRGIGLPVAEGCVPDDCFLPGVRIHHGTLVFDRQRLQWPGDLLHEAGHLAVAPAALRPTLSDGIELPDEVRHAGEMEATAWAYAAVCHLGLDPAVLFHAGGYHGKSAGLVVTYSMGVYPGAAGLADAGLTHVGPAARDAGLPVYPRMSRWLRD